MLRRVRAGELADRALDAAWTGPPGRERGWLQELVYGTLRLRGRIDHLLEPRVRGGLGGLEPDVLDILRLGAYQLLEMDSVPAYAAISQSQELARAVGAARAAPLIAGVLHALHREPELVRFPELEREPVEHLTSWGSHPRWLVERWVRRWGVPAAAELVAANNRRPELYVRPLGVPVPAAQARLAAAGIAAERLAFCESALRVLPPATAAGALAAVPSVVQDPAAALVVDYAAVPDGALALDLCAAPGGKALGLAERAAWVAAGDLAAGRLQRLRENAARVGALGRVAALAADGRAPPFRPGSADAVLVDAPCTGTGAVRRHPDSRWRLRPDHLPQLAALQSALLDAAAVLVRPGGLLVYSTCSLEAEENELQVDRFLGSHAGWRIEPPAGMPAGLVDAAGFLAVLPQDHGVDGAFAARLWREP